MQPADELLLQNGKALISFFLFFFGFGIFFCHFSAVVGGGGMAVWTRYILL